MALGAIKEYLQYHDQHSYSDDCILLLNDFISNNSFCESHKNGRNDGI